MSKYYRDLEIEEAAKVQALAAARSAGTPPAAAYFTAETIAILRGALDQARPLVARGVSGAHVPKPQRSRQAVLLARMDSVRDGLVQRGSDAIPVYEDWLRGIRTLFSDVDAHLAALGNSKSMTERRHSETVRSAVGIAWGKLHPPSMQARTP